MSRETRVSSWMCRRVEEQVVKWSPGYTSFAFKSGPAIIREDQSLFSLCDFSQKKHQVGMSFADAILH